MKTCPVCREGFTPRSHNQRFCGSSCSKRDQNERYRSTLEVATCGHCNGSFERTRGRSQHVYCSEECHCDAKRERYAKPLTHRVSFPPDEGHRDRANYRRAIRADPCAYCGERPANGVDHIEPTLNTGDRNDWTNWTASCKRCNETKRTLPLLSALPWIPVSRQYHDERRALFAA